MCENAWRFQSYPWFNFVITIHVVDATDLYIKYIKYRKLPESIINYRSREYYKMR